MCSTLELAKKLISKKSLTPDDNGCQKIIIDRLDPIGFKCKKIISGYVTNLWAIKRGSLYENGKILAFSGHTDVVSSGPLKYWLCPPFLPKCISGKLYGRGSSDMKTSIAAFIVATEEFVSDFPYHKGSIAFLITSDEEGPAIDGTKKIVDFIKKKNEKIDYCIVGEPTSNNTLGDTIKNGRRGSMSCELIIYGIQGHIAYPDKADNPIHKIIPFLSDLTLKKWDDGNKFFPPTTLQISNIHSGDGSKNVIPGCVELSFNFRFSSENNIENLKNSVKKILDIHKIKYNINWTINGLPFITKSCELSSALESAIFMETGIITKMSTTGGISDGRFIKKICPQVIEFGPPNNSIHKINEYIEIKFIDKLKNIYKNVLKKLIL